MKERDPLDVIGSVTYPDGTVATLYTDGTWDVPGRERIEGFLQDIYSDLWKGPQDGPYGGLAINTLAKDVGGVAWFKHRPGPEGDDVTY